MWICRCGFGCQQKDLDWSKPIGTLVRGLWPQWYTSTFILKMLFFCLLCLYSQCTAGYISEQRISKTPTMNKKKQFNNEFMNRMKWQCMEWTQNIKISIWAENVSWGHKSYCLSIGIDIAAYNAQQSWGNEFLTCK